MNDITTNNLPRIGIVLLVSLIILVFFWILIGLFLTAADFNEIYDSSTPLVETIVIFGRVVLVMGSPLVILLPAIFLVRKHTIIIGGLFLGLGVILSAYIVFTVLTASLEYHELMGLFFLGCLPAYMLLLDGSIFLADGVKKRRSKNNMNLNHP